MKKLLLSSAAICGLALAASPAFAAEDGGVKLDLGGHFKGYGTYVSQDEDVYNVGGGDEARSFDILRETEVHFTGETTLDNGLTVGAHIEVNADRTDGDIEESYVYFGGTWGRVNFGAEDGAAYLLQVAAPSADENYDGIRQFVAPANYGVMLAGAGILTSSDLVAFDYAQDVSGYADKFTYLTPVFNGFQAGLSYTPDVQNFSDSSRSLGVSTDDVAGEWGAAWEGAARYEGAFEQLTFALGAGYTHVDLESAAAGSEDRKAWNVGTDFGYGAFGLGAVYTHDNNGIDNNGDVREWVVGVDYTTGPFRIGASYFDQNQDLGFVDPDLDDLRTQRYTGGVVYTYGPGMTFRGSLSYIDHEVESVSNADGSATSVLLGTQINF